MHPLEGFSARTSEPEVALSRAKWRVVKLQLRAFEQVSKGKRPGGIRRFFFERTRLESDAL